MFNLKYMWAARHGGWSSRGCPQSAMFRPFPKLPKQTNHQNNRVSNVIWHKYRWGFVSHLDSGGHKVRCYAIEKATFDTA